MLVLRYRIIPVVAAILVGSTTYIREITIALTYLLLIYILCYRTSLVIKKNVFSDISFLLFFLGAFVSLVTLMFNAFSPEVTHTILSSVRKNIIEFAAALVIFLYFNDKSYEHIIKVLLIAFLVNSAVGLIQLVSGSFLRVPMLFVEPSSAGYFICSFIFLVLAEAKKSGVFPFVRYYIFLASLLVASKAQFLIYTIYFLLKRKRIFNIIFAVLAFSCIVIYTSIHQYLIENFVQYKGFAIMLNALKDIDASNVFNIYSTYSTRFVSIYIAIQTFLDNPFGVAFGEFSSIFKANFREYISAKVLSDEMIYILSDAGYASPKSKLLELILSTGWLGFFVIVIFSYKFIRRTYSRNYPLCLSFIFFLMSSILVELNNIYLYFILFSLLIMKFDEKPAASIKR